MRGRELAVIVAGAILSAAIVSGVLMIAGQGPAITGGVAAAVAGAVSAGLALRLKRGAPGDR